VPELAGAAAGEVTEQDQYPAQREEQARAYTVQESTQQRRTQGTDQPAKREDTRGRGGTPVKAVPEGHIHHGNRVLNPTFN
jgi:hypothetical protein